MTFTWKVPNFRNLADNMHPAVGIKSPLFSSLRHSDSVNELRNITSRFCDVILRDDKFTSCDHNVNNMRFEFYVVK